MLHLTSTEILIFSAVFGLLMGSFLSMLTWRLPRIMDLDGTEQFKKISVSRSACPSCQTSLTWKQLFPLFSWLISKGKCQHCQTKISARYPLIELTTAIFTVVSISLYGLTIEGYLAVLFSYFIITISVIDLEHHLILDNLSLPLLWIGLLINTQSIYTTPSSAIFGAVLGYMILWSIFQLFKMITGKEGMGFGDFKFLAALGAWFGADAIAQIILIASVSSVLVAVLLLAIKSKSIQSQIPFGPYLALGGVFTLVMGNLI